MTLIHPTAIVDPTAEIASTAKIGPYSIIGPEVSLGDEVEIYAHVIVAGYTELGARSQVFPFAHIAGAPQDKGYAGEPTRLAIGEDNVIREHVTIHTGTPAGGGCTRIGEDNFIMNSVHIAHDCQIGSHTIIASYSGLAGHVHVGDYAVLGAYTGVHQFTRVGESVMVAGNAKLVQDAPPFCLVAGDRARLAGLNVVGLRRRDFSVGTRKALKHAYHILFQSKLLQEPAFSRVREELGHEPQVMKLLAFLQESARGYCR